MSDAPASWTRLRRGEDGEGGRHVRASAEACRGRASRTRKTSTMLKSQSYTRFQQDTDIEGLKTRLLTQPVVVGVAACSLFMSLSGSGIFDDDACQSVGVNHSVLMVGYGKDTNSGSEYWIIKNSWATTWGDAGFGKVKILLVDDAALTSTVA